MYLYLYNQKFTNELEQIFGKPRRVYNGILNPYIYETFYVPILQNTDYLFVYSPLRDDVYLDEAIKIMGPFALEYEVALKTYGMIPEDYDLPIIP